MRHTQTLIAIAAFAAAGALSYAGALWSANAVERRSRQIVSHRLSLAGLEWVRVRTNGLQVILSGTAPTEAARFRALAVADGMVDSARVHDLMRTRPAKKIAPPRFSIELLRNEDGISLIGLIPTATGRATVASKVAALHAPGKVSDLLETAEAPVPPGWDEALAYGLVALKEVPRSKISISAGEVTVTGISDSAAQQKAYEADLAQAVPKGLKVSVDISAPRPVITPFTLRFVIDGAGARFDACSADTEKARHEIEAAALTAGVKGKILCTVGMGVPSPHWAEAAVLGIDALKDLGRGSITFSDADVTLLAPATVPQAKFDRVVGDLGAKLPDVFSLNAKLEKPQKATKSEGPARFTATLLPSGKISLRGLLLDDRMHDAVDSYAKAMFGAGDVLTATRNDKNLPDGWPERVLAGLKALALLHDGSVLVEPNQLTVTGTSGDKGAKDEISRILSEKLGPGQAFTIQVGYDKRLDAQAAAPSQESCLAAIQAALKAHKINFKPGSDSFTPDAAPTLDKIAEQIRRCPKMKLEIAGYTDSQGKPAMNLTLSQSRARAVLQALASRRVLIGNIVARGYGEAHPIADNSTAAGREANRRIEITLQSDAPDAKGAADQAGGAATGGTPAAANAAASASAKSGPQAGSQAAAQPAAPAKGDGLAPSDLTVTPKPRPKSTN